MYLEHFWLSVIGIFVSGMLSMLGIIIGVGMHKQAAYRPTVPFGHGFDPSNPINKRSALNQNYDENGWYEVTGDWD